MNPVLQFIFSRRSVRKFEDRDVPEAMLTDLLQAAMAAPSAVAKDPWRFLVVRRRETIMKLADIMPNAQMLRHVPLAIVACGDINRVHDRQESYMLQDLSAAVENLLLAANALGLGGCWLGVHPRRERMAGIKKLFDLPAGILPVCGIALGWPAEQPAPRTRYNQDYVYMEEWRQR